MAFAGRDYTLTDRIRAAPGGGVWRGYVIGFDVYPTTNYPRRPPKVTVRTYSLEWDGYGPPDTLTLDWDHPEPPTLGRYVLVVLEYAADVRAIRHVPWNKKVGWFVMSDVSAVIDGTWSVVPCAEEAGAGVPGVDSVHT